MATLAGRPAQRPVPLRWLLLPLAAGFIVLLLMLLMRWMIRAPEGAPQSPVQADSAQLVRIEPPKPRDDPQNAPQLPDAAPPPPPAAPPALARPALPAIAVPTIAITAPTVDVANTGVGAVNLGIGSGLGSSGVFGGFAGGGGNGNGNGGGGSGQGAGKFGRGEGFAGKELIPLSTARPQMPDWACKQKIKGWVEVVFNVNAQGRVENVRIVDAQPRGVYEGAAIESVGHWIYAQSGGVREVKQRVDMDPADCAYNYGQ